MKQINLDMMLRRAAEGVIISRSEIAMLVKTIQWQRQRIRFWRRAFYVLYQYTEEHSARKDTNVDTKRIG